MYEYVQIWFVLKMLYGMIGGFGILFVVLGFNFKSFFVVGSYGSGGGQSMMGNFEFLSGKIFC